MCFEVGINREEVVLRMAPDAAMLHKVCGTILCVRLSSFSIVVCAVCACAASSWGGYLAGYCRCSNYIQHVNRKAISSQEQQSSESSSCHNYLCSAERVRLLVCVYMADVNVRSAQVVLFQ